MHWRCCHVGDAQFTGVSGLFSPFIRIIFSPSLISLAVLYMLDDETRPILTQHLHHSITSLTEMLDEKQIILKILSFTNSFSSWQRSRTIRIAVTKSYLKPTDKRDNHLRYEIFLTFDWTRQDMTHCRIKLPMKI